MREFLEVYVVFGIWVSAMFCEELEGKPTKWHYALGVPLWPILILLWLTHVMHPEN